MFTILLNTFYILVFANQHNKYNWGYWFFLFFFIHLYYICQFVSVTLSLWCIWADQSVCPQRHRDTGRHDGGGRALGQHGGGGDGGRESHPVPGGEAYMGRPAEDHPQQPQAHRRSHQQGATRLPVHPEGRDQSALPPHLLPWWA